MVWPARTSASAAAQNPDTAPTAPPAIGSPRAAMPSPTIGDHGRMNHAMIRTVNARR